MIDKNKEAIKILEENKLTNIHSPEDKIKMEIDRIEVDHTKVDDRGPLDLTRQVDETDKRIKELDNSLSIALEINDKFQRENKKLVDRVREAEGETTIIKGIGMNSPEMREKDKLIQELRMRIRDMLLISEQHRDILGAEITDRKRLQQEVKDLKVQMSEYLSVRVKGARDNAG